jgi:hypothetical protein
MTLLQKQSVGPSLKPCTDAMKPHIRRRFTPCLSHFTSNSLIDFFSAKYDTAMSAEAHLSHNCFIILNNLNTYTFNLKIS